jgi:glutamate-1-semialdehyde 2,1-aminomutase
VNPAPALHARARRVLPGGVTASARANPALGHPMYLSRGEGAHVFDLEGRRYIDFCTSHGASLLGHGHPGVSAAVAKALAIGGLCAAETEHSIRLAEQLCDAVPCAEQVRFGGSGTETVMHGLRLARTATGRRLVVKFEGHFHGYSDALNYSVMPPLEHAGPACAPRPYAESGGMPAQAAEDLVLLPFNDFDALEQAFAQHGPRIAALLVEPVNYDQGCVMPADGFLQACRRLCSAHGAVLFFDEVLTAFRVALGGAQAHLGVTPDLCVLGKALGGGWPISALAGRRSVMQHLKPEGRSQMSGTFLAHPACVLAASAAVTVYSHPDFYPMLMRRSELFGDALQAAIDEVGVVVRLQQLGPRFGLYFGVDGPVTDYRQAARRDLAQEMVFIRACHARGVYLQPSAHHGFSAVHDEPVLMRAVAAMREALVEVRETAVEGKP